MPVLRSCASSFATSPMCATSGGICR
jgi:hypothetical protein